MSNEPLVSIIIACHNGEKYIDRCLQSLQKQTYSNFEIIICDDCSNDDSWQKLKEWEQKESRIILLRNKSNLFAGATRNNCIKNSSGQFIMFQDIDDESFPNRIKVLVNYLQSHPNIDFVSSSMLSFSDSISSITGTMKNRAHPTKYDFLWNLPFFNPAAMFRRECITAVGGFRIVPETKRMEDYDLFMRLYARGYTGDNIQEPLYYYRLDSNNIKRRKLHDRVDEMKIRAYGFKRMGILPLGIPFLLKPYVAYLCQMIKYRKLAKEDNGIKI